MPWTVDDPPNVAKNWSETEIKKCVAAANEALRDGGTDEDAIMACIGAAGRGKKQEEPHPHGEHECYCPECDYTTTVEENQRCNQLECPECGARLRATQTGERREKMSMSQSIRSLVKWLLGNDDEFAGWSPAVLVEQKDQDFKTEGGVKYRRTDYAVRGEAGKPTTWKLRMAEGSSGNFTVGQVARAITAMQPGGYRGQRVQLGPGEKEEAVRNISAAIGKVGDDDQKENLRGRLAKVKSLEAVSVGIKVFEVGEQSYWAAMTTNAFVDLEEEAFETKVLEDYVAAVDTGQIPEGFLQILKERGLPINPQGELWFAHIPHSRLGEPIWKGVHEHFLLEVGKFDGTPFAEAMAEHLKEHGADYRISHGYLYHEGDREDSVYSEPIWKFETSVLPASWAANPWTALQVLSKEAKVMQEKRRAALIAAIGEEHADALLSAAETKAEELKAAGVNFKELDEPEKEPEKKPEQEPEAEEQAPFVLQKDGEAMKLLVDGVGEALGLETMETAVKEATEKVAELAEQIKAIQDADRPWVVLDRKTWNRPSQDEDNIREKADPTPQRTPGEVFDDKLKGK